MAWHGHIATMPRVSCLRSAIQMAPSRTVQSVAATERIRGNSWQAIRERILARDRGVCQCEDCKTSGNVRIAHEVDHITPLDQGGSNADANLQAINHACHVAKTQREAKGRRL